MIQVIPGSSSINLDGAVRVVLLLIAEFVNTEIEPSFDSMFEIDDFMPALGFYTAFGVIFLFKKRTEATASS
jgi:hypothetical protein